MSKELNIFQLYQEYTKRTEPPANYHAWSVIGAISAMLGKKCYVPQGHFTVFPNLYIVLVGHAGMRKSTALGIAKSFVREIEQLPVAPESSTREALIDDMAKNKVSWSLDGKDISYWQSAAFVGEMEQFIGGKHINQQMVGFLTAIWDEMRFKERTRKGGEVIIPNPYFTLLGCCTDEWMNTKLSQDVISDGFSRRAIFVLETKLNCLNAWPETSDEELALRDQIAAHCTRIFNLAGRFVFSDQARQMWDQKYISTREDAKKHSVKVQNYFSSKHILVMKVAMCLSAALRNDKIIDSVTLRLAYDFLDETERKLDKVYSGVGDNALKSASDKVLDLIKEKAPGITHQELLRSVYDFLDLPKFKEVLEVLIAQGQVALVPGATAQASPVYRCAITEQPWEERNLLLQASCTRPLLEPVSAKQKCSEVARLIDPATERLLDAARERAKDQSKGILFRGKIRDLEDKSSPD